MSPSPTDGTSLEKKERWASGVTPYAEMGYYDADYVPKDTDIASVTLENSLPWLAAKAGKTGGRKKVKKTTTKKSATKKKATKKAAAKKTARKKKAAE